MVTVAILVLAVALEGQSLAEAAKREQERRRAQPRKPAPTFTDADLPAADAAVAAEPSPSPSPAAEDEPIGAPDEEEDRRQGERLWRARFAEARANLRTAESRAFEDRIGVAWKAGIPYQTMIREPVETQELKDARRALADLEEEFRRTGLPPGWSRE
jgi:hypothetical protein